MLVGLLAAHFASIKDPLTEPGKQWISTDGNRGVYKSLGSVGVRPIYCSIQTHDKSKFQVKFMTHLGSALANTVSFEVDGSYPDRFFFKEGWFLHNGRKQVFLSVIQGRIASYIFDFDGKELNVLYRMEEGRVQTSPHFTKKGQFYIKETDVYPVHFEGKRKVPNSLTTSLVYFRRDGTWTRRALN